MPRVVALGGGRITQGRAEQLLLFFYFIIFLSSSPFHGREKEIKRKKSSGFILGLGLREMIGPAAAAGEREVLI